MIYTCQICGMTFTNLGAAEKHENKCKQETVKNAWCLKISWTSEGAFEYRVIPLSGPTRKELLYKPQVYNAESYDDYEVVGREWVVYAETKEKAFAELDKLIAFAKADLINQLLKLEEAGEKFRKEYKA